MSNFNYRLKKFINEYIYRSILDKNSKNIVQQIFELIYLTYKTKYFPHNYYKFRGYLKGVDVKTILDYMPGTLFDSIRDEFFNEKRYTVLVEDKYLFSNYLSSYNLAGTEVLGLYIPSIGIVDKNYNKIDQNDFLSTLSSDFIIKPVSESAQGIGVTVVSLSEINNKQEFLTSLNENIKVESLIERKIEQHEKINALYADSINTVRIDTLIKLDGEIIIGNAILRVGKNGRKVDNWSGAQGGIAIPIDLKTGKLKEFGYDYFFQKYDKHPNTDIIFKDYEIPYFNEVTDLVKKAAKLFPKIKSLGWDVAITPSEPLIIETNYDYGIQIIQVGCPFFKNISFTEAVKEYVQSSPKGKKYKKYFNK